jgi:hypothetical protein
MTPLSKAVSRRTARPFMHYRRRLIVTLLPGNVLAIRLEREREARAVSTSIAELYRQLVTRRAASEARERAKARAAKRRLK